LPIRFAVVFPSVITCFPGLESNNFNRLVLIFPYSHTRWAHRFVKRSSGIPRPTLSVPARQSKRELLLLICCRCSRAKCLIQFMIVVKSKRGDLRFGGGIGAEQRAGKYLAQPELELALPAQLSAILSR
jgi:hypothetical protein